VVIKWDLVVSKEITNQGHLSEDGVPDLNWFIFRISKGAHGKTVRRNCVLVDISSWYDTR